MRMCAYPHLIVIMSIVECSFPAYAVVITCLVIVLSLSFFRGLYEEHCSRPQVALFGNAAVGHALWSQGSPLQLLCDPPDRHGVSMQAHT